MELDFTTNDFSLGNAQYLRVTQLTGHCKLHMVETE